MNRVGDTSSVSIQDGSLERIQIDRNYERYRGPADRPDARENRSGCSRYRRPSVLSSFVRLRRQALEPLGPLEPFSNCSARDRHRGSTTRSRGRRNGGRWSPSCTSNAPLGMVRSAGEQGRGWNEHECDTSEPDLWWRHLLAWSTPLRGWLPLMRTVGCQTEPGRTRISGHHFSWHRAPLPSWSRCTYAQETSKAAADGKFHVKPREANGTWWWVAVCIRVVPASISPLATPRADDESRFASGPPDASSPVSPCNSCAALIIATLGRPAASPRFRSSPGSLAAHDELVNGRRVRPQWTWLRHANWSLGAADAWFHVKHDRAALSLRAPFPDFPAPLSARWRPYLWPFGRHCLPCFALEAHQRGWLRLAFKARRSPSEGSV